jgi:hypothetical protein
MELLIVLILAIVGGILWGRTRAKRDQTPASQVIIDGQAKDPPLQG